MDTFNAIGAACAFPREAYRPSDLTGEQMLNLKRRLQREAGFDGLDDDAAEEAADRMFFHWFTRNYGKCAIGRGDHARAYYAIRKYARLSRWQGFTGQRRARKAAVTAEVIAMRERLRERNQPTPESVAVAVVLIARTPCHSRKAYRLAKRIGVPGVRELVREACGFGGE